MKDRKEQLSKQMQLYAVTDPVSYTHLDVYKRQDEGCPRNYVL